MTRSHKKKKTQVVNTLIEKENETPPLKAPPSSKHGAFKTHKHPTVAVAPQAQVGLLVTGELEKAIKECRTKVAQIVKGCQAANRRFRDIEFDLENDKIRCLKGLSYDYDNPEIPPAVLRVTQIFDKPHFFIDGAEAIDIIQGGLGDCWFLAALATMSTSKGLVEKLCVARDEEVGVYGFVFFRGSTWVSVVIDDQLFWSLPKYEELSSQEQALYRGDRETYNQLSRKGGKGLYFSRSGTEGETWVPLIEKAYAKLHGDYKSLEGGFASEAIEDMTGGVSVMYRTKDILNRDRFWKEELLHATQDRLFSCSFNGLDTSRKNEPVIEDLRVNGLLGSHAYSVLRVRECKGKRFVVIRNPWGASEWTGAWGDGSKEWTGEWLDVLKELGHVFGDDGEFVMEYCDFLDTFELIERTTIFDSSWVMSSHWVRVPPQGPDHPWTFGDLSFKFVLSKPSFTIIALSQLDTRYFKHVSGFSRWNLDFIVYKRGDKDITGGSFYATVMARSVTCELNLEAGEYIIFPRYDCYSSEPPPEYVELSRSSWDKRKLTRVLTEKAISRSIAVNLDAEVDADDLYFPTPIETLIEEDLEKLESAKQKLVNDSDDGDEKEEEDEEEDEAKPERAESDPEKVEGNPENAKSDRENGPTEKPVMSEFFGPPTPGFGYDFDNLDEVKEFFEAEDLILGVRIYTRGGSVVSLTGQVIGEEIGNKEKGENAKEKTKDKKEDPEAKGKKEVKDKEEKVKDKEEEVKDK